MLRIAPTRFTLPPFQNTPHVAHSTFPPPLPNHTIPRIPDTIEQWHSNDDPDALTMCRVLTNMTGAVDHRLARRRNRIVLLAGLTANQASRSWAAEPELPAVRFILAWGKEGIGLGEFHFPIGIATNRADEVLVAHHYNHRVQ